MKIILFIFISFVGFLYSNQKTILVFGGKTGWIGQKVVQAIKDSGHIPVCAESRLENREDITREINQIKPDYIINSAGLTGRPNVDWCDQHKEETIRVNIIGTLNLVDVAYLNNIHVTNLSTGCIYQYDKQHSIGIGFKEEDEPNFAGSFYSKTKILLEKLILEYPNVLNLRIKMPVSSDMHPRSFVGKIINYKKIVNLPNSLTILDDLLPVIVEMTTKEFKGNFNFANPKAISHNEILELYKQYVNPDLKYEICTSEEQAKMSPRSNCELDVTKLLSYFPNIPTAQKSIIRIFKNLR